MKIWGGPFQEAGISDILGCVDGAFFAFEVKQKFSRPTELQKLYLEEIREAGGCGEVVRSYQEASRYVQEHLDSRSGKRVTRLRSTDRSTYVERKPKRMGRKTRRYAA